MQQMLREGLTGGFLLLCSCQDIRKRKISAKLLAVFGLIGAVLALESEASWQIWAGRLLPGACMLLLSRLSGEAVGYGDGLAVFVCGLLLEPKRNIAMLLTGSFFCALAAAVLFAAGKAKRKTSLPFLPFLLAGFCVQLILDGR